MKILITGGCKNGKSFFAQELIHKLGENSDKFYIATMKPCDNEDLERIERHKSERVGYDFITVEQPLNISKCITSLNARGSVLLDSTTALLANEMFLSNGSVNENASKKVADELISLCKAVKNIALVSDYIYSDAELYDSFTEGYRKGLADIDRALAKECDVVIEISFGNKILHKGEKEFDFLWY